MHTQIYTPNKDQKKMEICYKKGKKISAVFERYHLKKNINSWWEKIEQKEEKKIPSKVLTLILEKTDRRKRTKIPNKGVYVVYIRSYQFY